MTSNIDLFPLTCREAHRVHGYSEVQGHAGQGVLGLHGVRRGQAGRSECVSNFTMSKFNLFFVFSVGFLFV